MERRKAGELNKIFGFYKNDFLKAKFHSQILCIFGKQEKQEMIQKYPISIQDFGELRTDSYVYGDKTMFAHQFNSSVVLFLLCLVLSLLK